MTSEEIEREAFRVNSGCDCDDCKQTIAEAMRALVSRAYEEAAQIVVERSAAQNEQRLPSIEARETAQHIRAQKVSLSDVRPQALSS
jgi:hypothetical protein